MIATATVIGRAHRLRQHNGQDVALGAAAAPGAAFGLVLDGCSSRAAGGRRSRSEAGAALLGARAAGVLTRLLPAAAPPASAAAPALPLDAVLQTLQQECLAFLHTLVQQVAGPEPGAAVRFVSAHLLTTLLGFIVTPTAALVFWQGDGFYCCNDAIVRLDAANRPDYLAYGCLPGAPTPAPLRRRTVARHNLTRLAVASDGWQPHQLARLAAPTSELALQRWVNRQARQRGLFEDDGAIASWWPAPTGARTPPGAA